MLGSRVGTQTTLIDQDHIREFVHVRAVHHVRHMSVVNQCQFSLYYSIDHFTILISAIATTNNKSIHRYVTEIL
jgi:hypothetical protein